MFLYNLGESCVSHAVAPPASGKMKHRLAEQLLPAICEPLIYFTFT